MAWGKPRTGKYGAQKTPGLDHNGAEVVYDSRMESERALELRRLAAALGNGPDGVEWQRWRTKIKLTRPDGITLLYMPDFRTRIGRTEPVYEDVKGYETKRFKMVCRAWKHSGPGTLVVLKKTARLGIFKWVSERIEGGGAKGDKSGGRPKAASRPACDRLEWFNNGDGNTDRQRSQENGTELGEKRSIGSASRGGKGDRTPLS